MAIIRVQYGSRTIDRYYKTHASNMEQHKVPYGVYAWVRGISISDMEKEAEDFFNRSKGLSPLFYVLDVEEASMGDMRAGVNAYIKKLRSLTNKKIGVYIAHHLYPKFNLELSKADFTWIPHYGANTGKVNSAPKYKCDLHQYTSVGKLPGYSGYLDINRLLNGRSLSFFIGEATNPTPKPAPKPAAPVQSDSTYTIKKGDTLGAIAKKFGTTVQALSKLNNIADVNKIWAGDTIKLKHATVASNKVYHRVVKGDTVSELAAKNKTTVKQIADWNNLKNPSLIHIGDSLRVK